MEWITSKENKKLKEARKLLTRKGRKQSGHYLIEGFHLLEEAIKAKAEIVQVFVDEEKVERLGKAVENVIVVPKVLLTSLSEMSTPQGVVAEVVKSELSDFEGKKVLVLENVQDPGNVGTMIRTADAAGFDAVFTTADTADVYSPKVMRSMQGSNFHLPLVTDIEASTLFDLLKNQGLELLVTTLSTHSVSYKTIKSEKFALVMGNEGAGISDLAQKKADQLIHIDMVGQAESLNVAVAAGILMFSLTKE